MAESGALTYEDLAAFPEDGLRREIIDGELVVSPSPKTRHQEVSGRLYFALRSHIVTHGGGRVFYAPLDVIFSDRNVVEPDLIVITDAQLDIITEANIKGVPSLVVEIVSNPRLDRVRKRDLYARFGVPEYWILDPDADRVEVYRHDGVGYGKPEIFEPGDLLRYEPLPGFELNLTALFER